MKKLAIAFDTSVLRKHRSLRSENIQLLAELSRINEIKLYIPKMVEFEILSQELNEIDEDYTKLINALSALQRKSPLASEDLINDISKYQDKMKEEKDIIQKKWNNFIRNNNIKIIPFLHIDTRKVFKDYIEGIPPYSKAKSRKDIPDSFIYHSILSLSEKEIHVLCCDKGLSKSFSLPQRKTIKCYESISDLIETGLLKSQINILEKLGDFENPLEQIKQSDEENRVRIVDYINQSLPIELLRKDGQKSSSKDKIVEIFKYNYLNINYDLARLYKQSQIIIPLIVNLDFLLEYEKTKNEYNTEKEASPWWDAFEDEFEIIEQGDKLIFREDYSGSLSFSMMVNINENLQYEEKNITFSEIRKKLIITQTFSKKAKKFLENKERSS